MARIFTNFFALGVRFITLWRKLDLDRFRFGDLLGVTQDDKARPASITLIVLMRTRVFDKLFFYTFDRLADQGHLLRLQSNRHANESLHCPSSASGSLG